MSNKQKNQKSYIEAAKELRAAFENLARTAMRPLDAHVSRFGAGFGGGILGNGRVTEQLAFETHYRIKVIRDGKVIHADEFKNLVVNVGLDDVLDKYFKGSAYTAAFYVGLTDGTPTVAAADTMSSHAGWVEVTAYDEAARQTLTLGTVSGQSVDNNASQATFTVSTNSTTIGGAFLATNSTKGGTSGTLYGAGAFSAGDVTINDGDVINVEVTLTAAAA